MALDSAARYRIGFQWYVKYRTKSVFDIAVNATADPSVTLPTSLVGICVKPSWNQNENLQPVTGAGSPTALSYVQGRREVDWGTRILVSNPAFIVNAFRNYTTPGATMGMTPFDLTHGICTDYTGDAETVGFVDCQFQSLAIDVSEQQPMTANVQVWPMALCSATPQALATAAPTAFDAIPIIWQGVSWGPSSGGVISTDYHPRLQSVRIQLGHGLQRIGTRKAYFNGAPEYNFSRTPYGIKPTIETLQISYVFRDYVPAALQSAFNNGQVVLYGEAVGVGAGRNWFAIAINNNYMNRIGQPEGDANTVYSCNAEMVGHTIYATSGTT